MSDPLSLAGSIAGLMSLADVVFRAVFKYVRAVKDSKSDIEALSTEINFLGADLRHLYALASELEAEKDTFGPTLRIYHLGQCDKTLMKIKQRLTKASDSFSRSNIASVTRQLKWPFSSSETKELLDDLSRHKQAIHVALSADTMRKLQLALSKTDHLRAQVTSVEVIVKRIEINTQIAIDEQRQEILDYFMKVSPRSRLDMSVKLRHPMTGLWLTESPVFQQWLETPGSMLWLSGIPGAGKTVLAGAVVQEALSRSHRVKDVAVSYFFCDYKEADTGEPANILGAVAHQLALQKPEAFDILSHYCDELHPPTYLPQMPDSEELRSKIGKMTELFNQTIIIIDGLDECGDNTHDVVETLVQLAEYSTNVSMALFSRDHFNIRSQLEGTFKHIQIAAHTDDIRLYVWEELERRIQTNRLRISNSEVRDEIAETLVQEAKGMFRWVVCQLDYLSGCSHDQERLEALKKLPPNLPESYRRLLERLDSCSLGVRRSVQMCLQFIAFAIEPLSILQLCQAVSTPEVLGSQLDTKNTISEQEIVHRCSSLIRKSEDEEHFEFAHFSVKEFLLDKGGLSGTANRPSLEAYWISESDAKDLLAAQCLRFLQLKNFDRQPVISEQELEWIDERYEIYPFYEYSAFWWLPLTAEDGLKNEDVLYLANSLFDPAKTAYFSNWTVYIYITALRAMDRNHQSSEIEYLEACEYVLGGSWRPIHMAAALGLPEICRSIIRQNSSHRMKFMGLAPVDLAITSIFGAFTTEILVGPFVMSPLDIFIDLENFQEIFSKLDDILSSAERKNQTINLLIEEGEMPSSDLLSAHAFFFVTCSMSTIWCDLSPVVCLIASGKVPTSFEVETFKKCLELNDGCQNTAMKTANMEKSTFELLQTLQSKTSFDSDWSFEVGQIAWKMALVLEYSFTTNTSLVIDSRISLSYKALVERAKLAIEDEDEEQLRKCLSDKRLNVSAPVLDDGRTILHLAAANSSPCAIRLLLDASREPLIASSSGNLPVHELVHQEEGFVEAVQIFADKQFSLLSTNGAGCTIWHLKAKDDPTAIFEYFSKAGSMIMAKALSTRDNAGETPLSLIFEKNRSEFEDVFISLAKLCASIPGFWNSHGPIFGAAARWGSDSIIHCLLGAGAEPEPAPAGTCSPLHNLPSSSSPEYVKLLQRIYPDAHKHRFEGRLPAELYIRRTFSSGHWPKLEIVGCLIPPAICSSLDKDGHMLWEFVCLLPRTAIHSLRGGFVGGMIDQTICLCLQLGVMAVYEDRKNKSGLISFFAELLVVARRTWCISASTLRHLISSTRFWTSRKTSEAAVHFLKAGVEDVNLEVVDALLSNNVSVHQRVEGLSVIEFACQGSVALRICGSEDGRRLMNRLLDHANADQLNEATPDGGGLRLLHRTASLDCDAGTAWLIKELIRRGVNINAKALGGHRESALTHHVYHRSIQSAELLLELGADPTVDSDESSMLDCAAAAILNSNADFLERLMVHNAQHRFAMAWGRPFSLLSSISGSRRHFHGINALHLASKVVGRIQCLELYLKQGFLTDVNAACAEGFTPLHFAAACNHLGAMNVLIVNGAKITAECNEKSTPLHRAAQNGHLEAAMLLVRHGATLSYDMYGKNPRASALDRDRHDIVNFLDEAFGSDVCTVAAQIGSPLSKAQVLTLSGAFQQAILEEDLSSCKRLVNCGCPVDIVFLRGGTALLLSTAMGQQEIPRWLINHGANVRKAMFIDNQWITAFELMFRNHGYDSLVPQLADEYIQQGGDLVRGDDHPLHQAAEVGNFKALKSFLECIDERIEAIASQLTRKRALLAILNRGRGQTQESPLHISAQGGNIIAVSILVEKGANLNITNSLGQTPFDIANSDGMRDHLAAFSACDTSRYSRIRTKSWLRMLPLGPKSEALLSDKSESSDLELAVRLGTCGLQLPIFCTQPRFGLDMARKWEELGYDLTQEDGAGRSTMQYSICQEHLADFVFHNDTGLHNTTPFPWHLHWFPFEKIAFLTSKFLMFRTHLPRETFRNILNLEPNRGWSPLCLAAYRNSVEIIENCLSMGAEIDFEGSPLGSALVVAGAFGKLDCVKYLVRSQASVSYIGKRGPMNVISLTRSEPVKAWLLVGRFNEQLRIDTSSSPNCGGSEAFKNWSGFVRVEFKLAGKMEKQPSESDLEWLKRLWAIRKTLQGEVISLGD
ncbi:hypothetical protein EDB81DRAFT_713509 [Dactylonectria macrodidyma]|uniref:Nephrocystin 3-like N-terminal domain-containing protein n=1 Tax=Dactylonectria macrodidyma TaxID=307937 RepID=A0A9P9FGL6_9HYPO|nr:hypothetical protein EDB81DRAFT_713509 [Dactylonectria macrodidyma]